MTHKAGAEELLSHPYLSSDAEAKVHALLAISDSVDWVGTQELAHIRSLLQDLTLAVENLTLRLTELVDR